MSEFKNETKNKRYYWLQLKTDFFDQKEIKLLRKIAGGDTYTIIYLKMLLASLKDEGRLYFESIGDDFAEEIALLIDEDTDNVEITLKFLEAKKLIEVVEHDEYFLNRVPELIGSEAYSTARSRRHRERKKAQELLQKNDEMLQCNTNETECNDSQLRYIEDIKNNYINNIDRVFCEEEETPSPQVEKISLTDRFEIIWEQYPTGRKQGKDKAFKSYQKAIKDGVEDSTILNGINAYKKQIELQKTDTQYVKQGSTWFNGKCWNDEYITTNNVSSNKPDYVVVPQEWQEMYKDVGKMPEPKEDYDLDSLPF
ncbi:phage replisome organizer N-terminal domain-containing protein [Vagococcus carniphilus]|uniref:phage replisome organizer N-terminal domain-containing protein n=1 Tax=Vagococcus carniphilus TaxID=218144 RepID=UPI00288D9EC0|nr:phage replisome organizer N-terminal domain-containing protein [Vagococcus carniphilus]MDT2864279.1 phage replisome organizer N-terminal domain-containing protein [Vagococcus carniphilus]